MIDKETQRLKKENVTLKRQVDELESQVIQTMEKYQIRESAFRAEIKELKAYLKGWEK